MWNCRSQCKICYKICDENEFLKNKKLSSSEQDQSEEDRRELLHLCSLFIFSEVCNWKSICWKDTLPFCAECFGVLTQIDILNENCKIMKTEMFAFCDQFAMKVLRLRNHQRDPAELFPKIVGEVTIKFEEGVGEESRCKICHGTYIEKTKNVNERLNLAMVTKVTRTCKKYLFAEIFDPRSLDVHFIARRNKLQFCFDCYLNIQDLCRKSDLIDNTFEEIQSIANIFTLKVLNFRRNRKLINSNFEESVINVSMLAPDPASIHRDSETLRAPEPEEDDDCVIIAVISAADAQRNVVNAISSHLIDDTNELLTPPPPPPLGQTDRPERQGRSDSPILPTNKEVPTIEKTDLSPISSGIKDTRQCTLSEETPGPSAISRCTQQWGAIYKCHNCESVFTEKLTLVQHAESCFQGGTIFECKDCGENFSDAVDFRAHVKTHDKVPIRNIMKCYPSTAILKSKRGNKLKNQEAEMVNQLSTVQPEKKSYNCSSCIRSFRKRIHLKNHLKWKSVLRNRRGLLQTTLLWKQAQTSEELKSTKKTRKAGERIFKCPMCPLIFTAQRLLWNHYKTHYDITNAPKSCDFCRKVFATTRHRDIHMSVRHPNPIILVSSHNSDNPALDGETKENTGYKSEDEEEFDEVVKSESDDEKEDPDYDPDSPVKTRTYRCTVCKTRLPTLKKLRSHLQKHYEKAPYRCTTCKVVFNRQRGLFRHIDEADVHARLLSI